MYIYIHCFGFSIITCLNIACELLAEHLACPILACMENRNHRSLDILYDIQPDKHASGRYVQVHLNYVSLG